MSDANTPARIGEFIFYCVRLQGDEEGDILASTLDIDELYAEAAASDGFLKFSGALLECEDRSGRKAKKLLYVGRAPADSALVRYHDRCSDPFAPDEDDEDDQDDDGGETGERSETPVIPMPEPPRMPSLR